ncbi:glutathione peroxidase [Phaeobacter sp.]|uniref:glutathione peroxidase n=1 Tax=Phaeobacter sp. TaxID=1902409 RepID=UPI0025DDE627|nr:glutathione peroxidase [Phaeobacter sp.]
MRGFLMMALLCGFALPAQAVDLASPFRSIDGGDLRLSDWDGCPFLVVNTASQCAFTRQYRALQQLYDRYRDRGLVVVAVPSNDFKQELETNEAVKEFCEVQYGLTFPMSEITSITGQEAHPFYASLKSENGFVPRWNFNKVLIDTDGSVVKTYGSRVAPLSGQLTGAIDRLLD